jgi:hypothetical protein
MGALKIARIGPLPGKLPQFEQLLGAVILCLAFRVLARRAAEVAIVMTSMDMAVAHGIVP